MWRVVNKYTTSYGLGSVQWTLSFFLSCMKKNELFSILTQPVKIWWLLCIVNKELTIKTTTMGLNYIIECRACGSHSEYRTTINVCGVNTHLHLTDHVDTECAIRCPVCRAKLNKSEADFRQQVSISLSE